MGAYLVINLYLVFTKKYASMETIFIIPNYSNWRNHQNLLFLVLISNTMLFVKTLQSFNILWFYSMVRQQSILTSNIIPSTENY
ncbi:unnamed protein product [Commensalibacter communis]|nr:unnamed protein product [Commensalibacter communis]CAI3952216.1 unnamed protein product [Commensalibacter communis]CAI3958514.1 unnamed protein product [Commensalibacter communis]